MKSPSLKDRLKYAFDETLSKGAMGLIGWLALFSLMLIALISFVVWKFQAAPNALDFWAIFWMSLLRTLDPGTMGSDQGSWFFLFAMLIVTLGGVFIISTLIGIINTTISERLENLRKGRSWVIEEDHTVILGWTQEIFNVISELVLTNVNHKNPCIVILASRDKVEMEDEIKNYVPNLGKTRVICRTGNPLEFNDLEITNLNSARSIIILSPDDDNPDSEVIKTLLAIINNPNRHLEPYHIVAVIHDPINLEVAHMVGKDEVILLLEDDVISRIIAQTCRQTGLSVIYKEILDFTDDDIYFTEKKSLYGKYFDDLVFAFKSSCLIGIMKKGNLPKLNPPKGTLYEEGDQLICLTHNSKDIPVSFDDYCIEKKYIKNISKKEKKPEKTLILGWNSRAPLIVKQLENYVVSGSSVTIVAETGKVKNIIREELSGLKFQKVDFVLGDVTSRKLLDKLKIHEYDHTILLSNLDLPAQQADSRVLITLLHLRDIAQHGKYYFSIVSEMIDPNNCKLASIARVDDFVVGTQLLSFLLTQISENKHLSHVYDEVFDARGSEIYLKPASNYLETGSQVNFYTLMESARCKNEICIGYRIFDNYKDSKNSYGVVINPKKTDYFTLNQKDKVIVIAED